MLCFTVLLRYLVVPRPPRPFRVHNLFCLVSHTDLLVLVTLATSTSTQVCNTSHILILHVLLFMLWRQRVLTAISCLPNPYSYPLARCPTPRRRRTCPVPRAAVQRLAVHVKPEEEEAQVLASSLSIKF